MFGGIWKITLKNITPGIYKHYKGKKYEVLNIATHSETLDKLIVYKALYDSDKFGNKAIWVRSIEMFTENLVIKGKKVPRFKFIK